MTFSPLTPNLSQTTYTCFFSIPGFYLDNEIVKEVTLEMLSLAILDGAENEEEVDGCLFYSMLADKCLGFRNRPKITDYSTQDDYTLLFHPSHALEVFSHRVEESLRTILRLNREQLLWISASLIVDDVEIRREYSERVLLSIKGRKL